ncbi:hypothetical protein R69888_01288 [Paraburkholderia haematera]|uniref:Uncharacterized protein n=1 Tax=Paraburkholderia haematera TaxID=2793077 RepID=A0ABM8QT69_9BURK|nr:hypothetical protein R69888_01288 [Paraburkholderia haematera]
MSIAHERSRGLRDWSDQRWRSLVALSYVCHGKDGARWRFQCDCGHRGAYYLRQVQRGERTTCGCDTKPAPATAWPFPRVLGSDGRPVSSVHRAALLAQAA